MNAVVIERADSTLTRSSSRGIAYDCPIKAALGAAAIVGTAGGLIGGLVGMGMPEFAAKRYDAKVREGNILISVHVENLDQRSTAKDIFKQHDADDIASASEAKAA